jgi:antitoxin HigA-1
MHKYKHRVPTPPGEILTEEFLGPLGLSQRAFARHVGWSHSKLNDIIRGKRGITPKIAMVFADALDTTAQFWLNAQLALNLWNAKQNHKKVPRLPQLKKVSTRIKRLEHQDVQGYKRQPIRPGEFDVWHTEQIWPK